jgi:hypothetical protein
MRPSPLGFNNFADLVNKNAFRQVHSKGAQEAIQSAIELAERNTHQQVEPRAFACRNARAAEGIVRPILGKLGANVAVVLNDTQTQWLDFLVYKAGSSTLAYAPVDIYRLAKTSRQDAGRVYLDRTSASGSG